MAENTPAKSDKKWIGYVCGVLATLFWGFHPVLIRYLASEGVDAYSIAGFRLYIGSIFLTLIILFQAGITRKALPETKYGPFFWLTGIGLGVNFLLFHKGLEFTIASDAILLETFAPAVVLMLVVIFLPNRVRHLAHEPGIVRKLLLIVLAGSVGSSLLLVNDAHGAMLDPNKKLIGDVIEFAAMFFFAMFLLGSHEYRKLNAQASSLLNTAKFLFIAALIITPFMAWNELSAISTENWRWIFVLGIFSTAITYVLWHNASRYIDVIPLTILFSLTSVFNVGLEAVIFDLPLSPKLILGAILIICSAIAAEILNSRYKILEARELGD